MISLRRSLSFAVFLLIPVAATADPVAHREVLPNGIVLLVAERPAVPVVAVRAYFRAGSAFDPPEASGLANLTAELLTRGTRTRTGRELDRAIEFVGGSLESEASRDGITVALSILKKDLPLGLDLLADVVRAPSFPEDELARKIKETLAGIQRSEENPEAVAGRELMRLVYADHPYGHPVEGTRAAVGTLTRDDVTRFYERHVRPDSAIVSVVGAVTVDEARREIARRLGDWPRPATPPAAVQLGTPAAAPRDRTVPRDLSQATAYLGRRAIRQDDPDYFALVVANYVLGGGGSSRLYQRVREEAGLAYSVYSYVAPGRYGAAAVVGLQTRASEVARALSLVRAELARMGRERVSEKELALAKSFLAGSFPLRLDTSSKVANFLIGIEEQGLGLDYAETFRERVMAVTADDVQRVSVRFLRPETFDAVTVGKDLPAGDAKE
jgi:zinc protease